MGALTSKYRQKFAGLKVGANSLESLELGAPVLPVDQIEQRGEVARESLHKIIENYLDDDPKLKAIADKIAKNGADALKAVAGDDDNYLLKHPAKTNYLEVIVRTDGSRPSFMIRNGKPDPDTSPSEDWWDIISSSGDCLNKAIACVGRIDLNEKQMGTGFLIHQNLILTNRHVLQLVAVELADGTWTLKPGATIDFGYEYRAIASLNRRKLKQVIFAGLKPIDIFKVDHSKLDLALIELEPVSQEMVPLTFMSVGAAKDWAAEETTIYTIGYPGNPGFEGLKTYKSLLEQLFKMTFGYKRLAPGVIINSKKNAQPLNLAHDATTLGGNSGSLLLSFGKECVAAGLHYGGSVNAPRENWGHVLGQALEAKNKYGKSLKEFMDEYSIEFSDNV